jgi:phosphoserine phosphatase RsbU/P
MFPDWTYEEGTVQLNPGDLVLAYTDGVIEALNPGGEEWQVDGLRRAAEQTGAKSAEAIVNSIFTSWMNFHAGARPMTRQSQYCECSEYWLRDRFHDPLETIKC